MDPDEAELRAEMSAALDAELEAHMGIRDDGMRRELPGWYVAPVGLLRMWHTAHLLSGCCARPAGGPSCP